MVRAARWLAISSVAAGLLASHPRRACADDAADAGVATSVPGDSGVPPERAAEAERLVAEGTEAYKAGDYARAASTLEHANEVLPTPRLLFNIARAWEKAGKVELAIEFYVRYLRAGDAEPDLVRRAGEALDVLRARGSSISSPPATVAAVPSAPARAPDGPPPDPTLRTLGIVGLAGGLAVLVAAVVVDGGVTSGLIDDFEEAKKRGDGSALDAQGDVETAQTVALVGYVAGGILAAAGAGALILSAQSAAPARAAVSTRASPGPLGARWTMRW